MFEQLTQTFNQIDPAFKSPAGFGTIEGLAYGIGNLMVGAAISITLISLVYSFILFSSAQGDPKMMAKARSAVWWSLIAMFLSLLSYGIRAVVFKTMGMQ